MIGLKRLRSVEILRLQPGDKLVVEYDGPLTRDAVNEIRGQVERAFPGYPVTVLNRLTLKIVRDEAGS